MRLDGVWIHVGTPQGLEEAEVFLRDLARVPLMARRAAAVQHSRRDSLCARAVRRASLARAGGGPLAARRHADPRPDAARDAGIARCLFAMPSTGAALLPKIIALGDVEEDFDPGDFNSMAANSGAAAPSAARHPGAAVGCCTRISVSAAAGAQFRGPNSAASSMSAITQRADLSRLTELAPGDFAAHWDEVISFLNIIAVQWPKVLEAENAVEPATIRDGKLRALRETPRQFAAGRAGDRRRINRIHSRDR